MTDKHTRGPWRWVPEPDTSGPWLEYGKLYSASSEVVLSGWENDYEEGVRVNSHADAWLIAAAPELLEALEEARTFRPSGAEGLAEVRGREAADAEAAR